MKSWFLLRKRMTIKSIKKLLMLLKTLMLQILIKKEVLEKITQKTSNKKVKKLIPNWMFAAAASIALLFSTVYYLTGTNESFSTSFGEQLALVLPDGSEVLLNSKSTLSYKKSDWFDGKRTLELTGEGYFKVKKGSTFSVNSTNGNVSVLGTQFNVKTNPSYFEVLCYEGRVQVKTMKKQLF